MIENHNTILSICQQVNSQRTKVNFSEYYLNVFYIFDNIIIPVPVYTNNTYSNTNQTLCIHNIIITSKFKIFAEFQ